MSNVTKYLSCLQHMTFNNSYINMDYLYTTVINFSHLKGDEQLYQNPPTY